MLSSPSDPPSLIQHLRALYPLARVLVGSEDAEALLGRVYEHAAQIPPSDRPADTQAWLFQLALDVQNDARQSTLPDAAPESSFTDDPFRREVAEQMAKEKLPIAFAACSIRERFILAIDALADPSDEVLADALDTSAPDARSTRDRARSGLRASLRDVLTGPERMLVDIALPDDALKSHLRTVLTDRFHPVPSSLHTQIAEIVNQAETTRSSNSSRSISKWLATSLQSVTPPALFSLRGFLTLLITLLLIAAGLGGVSYLTTSSPPPSTNLVDLSTQKALSIERAHPVSTPDAAASYIQQRWNRHLSVPTITGAAVTSVGDASIADHSVPALLYTDDEHDQTLTAFAFNYALFDQFGTHVVVPEQLRSTLAVPDTVIAHQRADQTVLLWRQQDDVFVLVAPNTSPKALRDRIRRY